jgi:hypothetical protein
MRKMSEPPLFPPNPDDTPENRAIMEKLAKEQPSSPKKRPMSKDEREIAQFLMYGDPYSCRDYCRDEKSDD